MSDLISRKAVLKLMRELLEISEYDGDKIIMVKDDIEKLPTAYDVDGVVERLEICKNSFPFGTWHDMIEEAVSIVKGGGRDE